MQQHANTRTCLCGAMFYDAYCLHIFSAFLVWRLAQCTHPLADGLWRFAWTCQVDYSTILELGGARQFAYTVLVFIQLTLSIHLASTFSAGCCCDSDTRFCRFSSDGAKRFVYKYGFIFSWCGTIRLHLTLQSLWITTYKIGRRHQNFYKAGLRI